jgi:Transglycosylase associated protein
LRLLDIVRGIVGAIVGGFIFSAFGASGITGFNLYNMIVSGPKVRGLSPGGERIRTSGSGASGEADAFLPVKEANADA